MINYWFSYVITVYPEVVTWDCIYYGLNGYA